MGGGTRSIGETGFGTCRVCSEMRGPRLGGERKTQALPSEGSQSHWETDKFTHLNAVQLVLEGSESRNSNQNCDAGNDTWASS